MSEANLPTSGLPLWHRDIQIGKCQFDFIKRDFQNIVFIGGMELEDVYC